MKLNYSSILDFLNAKFVGTQALKDKSLCLTVRPDKLYDIFCFIKNSWSLKYDILIDITAIHYASPVKTNNYKNSHEFSVVYNLLSTDYNQRLTIECLLNNSLEYVPSVTSIYPCAAWYERETYDMFGILFYGNKDLRRILTDYGFEGFPLRKDFPVSGYLEARFCEKSKRVVLESVSLTQANRTFEFESPWR
jgi:NADH-quinone oxidoreductase subunit C